MLVCTRREASLSVFFLLVTLFVFMATYNRDVIHDSPVPIKIVYPEHNVVAKAPKCVREEELYTDRIRLSRMLNSIKHDFSRLSCEMMKLQVKGGMQINSAVSVSGGWCKTASRSTGGSHIHDGSLSEKLSQFFAGKVVASFGDGPGDYKISIDKTGRVTRYDAYDGAPYCNETSGGIVQFLDLTAPQYGLPLYDWILSLEVAEHIPARFESIYIDNIVRHAKQGIILSWAVPGQGGLSHVNNRPLHYVKSILASRGFLHDTEASESLKNSSKLAWLKKNVNVYRRDISNPANPKDS